MLPANLENLAVATGLQKVSFHSNPKEVKWTELAQLCPTLWDPWTVAYQAPPSMGFSRQEYWSGLPLPKKGNAKECSNYCTIALISHTSKVMLKILQGRLQKYVSRDLSDIQAGFRKWRGTRDQIANIRYIVEKAKEFQKNIYFCLLTIPKPLTVWITTNCGKFWKRWEYQTTRPVSWEICMQVRKQQLELDMEQQTGFK